MLSSVNMSLPPLIVPPSFHSTSIVGGRGDGGCGGGGGGEGGGDGEGGGGNGGGFGGGDGS